MVKKVYVLLLTVFLLNNLQVQHILLRGVGLYGGLEA